MLLTYLHEGVVEAGCDEAGRGCLAGPVYAAAVILPPDFSNELLNDSKQLTESQRYQLRPIIESSAIAWAIGVCDNREIDARNILRCSIEAMHRAVRALKVRPEMLLIDGNRFTKFEDLPYETIVKGDGRLMSIAAASVLAKTYRDDYMMQIDQEFPVYNWKGNKGYPTRDHRQAIARFGPCKYHRMTFRLLPDQDPQLTIDFG